VHAHCLRQPALNLIENPFENCYKDFSDLLSLARKLRKFLCLERVTIAEWQGASEGQKFAAELTQTS
jgi:hypothetical protein